MDLEVFFADYFPFWEHLSPKEKQALCAGTRRATYKRGEPIHGGAECTGAIIVLHGALRTYMLSEEGKEVTLYRLYDKDVCMLSASCALAAITFEVSVEADEDTECLILDSGMLGRLVEDNVHVKNYALEITVGHFSEVMWIFEQILFMSFDKRLAIFLLDECAKCGSDTIRLTHEQIAKYMGSAREVVTRMLRYFSAEGIVESSRGGVTIKDKQKLRRYLA